MIGQGTTYKTTKYYQVSLPELYGGVRLTFIILARVFFSLRGSTRDDD